MAWARPDGVKSRNEDKDLLVRGRVPRNRAVNGDVVYVEIVEGDNDAGVDKEEEGVNVGGPLVDSSDSDEEVVLLGAVMASEDNNGRGKGAAGAGKKGRNANCRVVAIAEAKGSRRVIVCTLHPNRGKDEGDEDDLFVDDESVLENDRVLKAKPTDRRMPWILIQINPVTRKALKLPAKGAGKINKYELWPVQILKWKETSHLPLGRLKGACLGEAGDLEAEVKHALIENELDDHDVDFEDDLLDSVDEIVTEAKASFEHEKTIRHDLTRKRIFTIDPATAKDLDDAIHVDYIPDRKQVEIGVHIADVGHFLKLGSIADTEAQRRSTSVYLIDRVLPMLPHALCNHLCSLNPNDPKLAFSAFFRLDAETGELIRDNPKPWFEKTVISSCCRLNYEEAQMVLDKKEFDEPPVYGDWNWQSIKDDMAVLYDVCGKVRKGRMEGGAMSITKTKMVFHTHESEDGVPTDYHLESHSASHWIIEELMLLANRCVAEHLAHSSLWDKGSVLRNHKAPDPVKAEVLSKLMKSNLGIKTWDSSDAGALYRSCQEIYRNYGTVLGQCVEMMTMRAGMQQAEYFCMGPDENPHHYALNFSHYTHFTSPIRRYPDVMVHRVLYALLLAEGADGEAKEDTFQGGEVASDQLQICNDKKTKSRKCQEQLDRSVFCVFLRKRGEWFYTIGNVLSMSEDRKGGNDSVTLYCSQLGKEKKVSLCGEADIEKMMLCEVEGDTLLLPKTWKFRGKGYLELDWQQPGDPDGPLTRQTIQVLSALPIVVIPTKTVPIDFAMFIVSPFHRRFGHVSQGISEVAKKGFEWTCDEGDEDGVEVVHSAE